MTSTRTAATATAGVLAVLAGLGVAALSGPAQASTTVQASRSWAAPAPSVVQAKGSTWAGHTAVQPAAKWWGHGKAPAGILLAAYTPGRKFGPASITLA